MADKPTKSVTKSVTVRVLPDRLLHTHPDHVDGLHAPPAEVLAESGGIDGPAEVHRPGDEIELPADEAERLVHEGVVEKV